MTVTGAERAVERRTGASADLPTLEGPVTLHDRLSATDPTVVLPRQLLLAQERSAWLGERLREQVEREGIHGITGTSYSLSVDGRVIEAGEFTRDLAAQERREREHVAVLAEKCARLGISDGAQARDSDVSHWMARAVREAMLEFGHDLDDPEVVRRSVDAFSRVWDARQGPGWTSAQHRSAFGASGMPDPPVQ